MINDELEKIRELKNQLEALRNQKENLDNDIQNSDSDISKSIKYLQGIQLSKSQKKDFDRVCQSHNARQMAMGLGQLDGDGLDVSNDEIERIKSFADRNIS